MFLIADIVLTIVAVLLVVAVASAIVSKVLSVRKNRSATVVNGIPARRITWIVTGGTVLLLAITFFALPADTLIVNGEDFDDTLLLRMTGMCVTSCIALLVGATVSVLFGYFKKR